MPRSVLLAGLELGSRHFVLSVGTFDEQQQLMSNPIYVEGLIRSTFKVAQPDEYVVPLNDRSSR